MREYLVLPGLQKKGKLTCSKRLMKARILLRLTSALMALNRRLRHMADLLLFASSGWSSKPYKALQRTFQTGWGLNIKSKVSDAQVLTNYLDRHV